MLSPLQTMRATAGRRVFQAVNRIALPIVKAGLGSPLPIGVGLVVLETTGRVSGRRRQVPLVAARIGDRVEVGTLRRSSQWARNVEATGEVSLWLGGHERPATGTVERGRLTVARLRLG